MIDWCQSPHWPSGYDLDTADRLTRCFLEVRNELLKFLTRRTGNQAEDLLQEVWLNLRERSDPAAWREPRAVIFRTAANLATDASRRQMRGEKIFAHEEPDAACPSSDPQAQAEALWKMEHLVAALEELPVPCREAFLLNRLESLTHAQIAQRLGVSTKSVQRYIERALRHCLKLHEP